MIGIAGRGFGGLAEISHHSSIFAARAPTLDLMQSVGG